MQSLGNDFVVLDYIRHPMELGHDDFVRIADRRFGIGCDQILIVEPSTQQDVDFVYRIVNSDGGEIGQCGNGARCFATYVKDQGLTEKDAITVATKSSVMELRANADGSITVNMGVVSFDPADVPFVADEQQATYELDLGDESVTVSVADIGNPHAVLLVDDVNTIDIDRLGPAIENHPRFPERANVEFMQCVSRDKVKIRVYERGVKETLACGSGACAAVAVGQELGLLDSVVEVEFPGGGMTIERRGIDQPVLMTGPAHFSFRGEYFLDH